MNLSIEQDKSQLNSGKNFKNRSNFNVSREDLLHFDHRYKSLVQKTTKNLNRTSLITQENSDWQDAYRTSTLD